MSDTHRNHLPATKLAKRGPTARARVEVYDPHGHRHTIGGVGFVKSSKQRRVNERVAFKKENA